jgi:hypothetical protein
MIDEVGGRVYFILSHDICRYEQKNEYFTTGEYFSNGNFAKQFSINDPNFDDQIYGCNEKNIFINMQDGIVHYNGTDLQYLFRFSHNFTYTPVPAIFENDVFFRVYDGADDVLTVMHGKLIK